MYRSNYVNAKTRVAQANSKFTNVNYSYQAQCEHTETIKKNVFEAKARVAKAESSHANIDRNNYVYQHQYEHKWTTKKRVVKWLKFSHYQTKHHSRWITETRFKDAEYNHDLQVAKQNLKNATQDLGNIQLQLEREMAVKAAQAGRYAAEKQNLNQANQDLLNIQKQLEREMGAKVAQASNALLIAAREKAAAEGVAAQSANNLAAQLRQKSLFLQKEAQLQAQKVELEQRISVAQAEVQRKHQETMEYILKLTDIDRAKLLIQCFDKEVMEAVVKRILLLGFDMEFAAADSLAKGQFNLFEYLLEQGVDCDRIAIGDENLIKYAARCCPEMLEKILQATNDFSCTFAKAINDNDLAFLDSIFAHRPELMAINFMNKVNLLQLAVMKNSLEVTKYLLEHKKAEDYDLINLPMMENGQKLFQFAMREASGDMIELLLSHVNVEIEIVNFINANNEENNGFIAKLIQVNPSLINGSLVFHALQQNNLEAAKLMLTDESLIEAVVIVVDKGRLDLLALLVQERPELAQEVEIVQLLELYNLDDAVQNEEELIQAVLAEHSVNEAEMELLGVPDVELYANLEY